MNIQLTCIRLRYARLLQHDQRYFLYGICIYNESPQITKCGKPFCKIRCSLLADKDKSKPLQQIHAILTDTFNDALKKYVSLLRWQFEESRPLASTEISIDQLAYDVERIAMQGPQTAGRRRSARKTYARRGTRRVPKSGGRRRRSSSRGRKWRKGRRACTRRK